MIDVFRLADIIRAEGGSSITATIKRIAGDIEANIGGEIMKAIPPRREFYVAFPRPIMSELDLSTLGAKPRRRRRPRRS